MKYNKIIAVLGSAAFTLLNIGQDGASAAPVYLNSSNMVVSLGASMAPEPFVNTTTAEALSHAIDAPTAASGEIHNSPGTHVWINSAPLELDFDFGKEYDLTSLHFWNYYTEYYDVDNIFFKFFDEGNSQVGTLDFDPDTGTSSPLTAQNYLLNFPSKVRYVNALFTGTNGQVDFNNIGFTGELSNPSVVPLPASLPLVGSGLALMGFLGWRKKRKIE